MINKMKMIIRPYFTWSDFRKTFTLLKPFVLQYKKAYFILFVILMIQIFFTLAFAWFFGNLTDAAISSNLDRIKMLVPIGIGLILFNIFLSYLYILNETVAINGIKKELKSYLFSHILRLPAQKIANLESGDLLSHFNNDIQSIDGVIGSNLIELIRFPMIYIAVFTYLYHINFVLCLISLVSAPLAIILGIMFGLLLRRNNRRIYSLFGQINTVLNESFSGFTVIRSFTLEKMTFNKLLHKNEELYHLERENAKLRAWFYTAGELLSSFSFLVGLCLGAYFVFKGEMTVGSLLIFINLVNYLVSPLMGLASMWASFQRSATAVERLSIVLDLHPESDTLPSNNKTLTTISSIRFQDVTFHYDDHEPIFNQFQLDVPVGKVVALVGPSGAGKSTLFHLLQGIYKPDQGHVFVNNQSTHHYASEELRSAFAFVPQETFLFSGTIRANLLIVRPKITELEMEQACIQADLHNFVMSLPEGYDTEIGEKGIRLSGGQKQRLAIARAILKNAPILLLDEATSALDNETERNVQKALQQLMKNRTTIIIAHRLSTIQNADLIIVIDHGKIIEMGSHEELLQNGSRYEKLYDIQFNNKTKNAISVIAE